MRLTPRPVPAWIWFAPALLLIAILLTATLHQRQPRVEIIPLPVWVIPDAGNTWRVVDPERESMDAITDATALGSVSVASLELSSRRIGFPAAVYIKNTASLSLRPFGAGEPPALTPELRERVLIAMSAQRNTPAFPDLLHADTVRVHWSWLGLATNAALLVAMIAGCLLTIRLLWLIAYNLRAARRSRALKRGLCPACRYNLAGLSTPTEHCPECGSSWNLHA